MTKYPYHNFPGFQNKDTSYQAAKDMAPKASTIRKKCLDLFRQYPKGLTADEIAVMLKMHVLSVRPRVTELSKSKPPLIFDTGERRTSPTFGKTAIVWRIMPDE